MINITFLRRNKMGDRSALKEVFGYSDENIKELPKSNIGMLTMKDSFRYMRAHFNELVGKKASGKFTLKSSVPSSDDDYVKVVLKDGQLEKWEEQSPRNVYVGGYNTLEAWVKDGLVTLVKDNGAFKAVDPLWSEFIPDAKEFKSFELSSGEMNTYKTGNAEVVRKAKNYHGVE